MSQLPSSASGPSQTTDAELAAQVVAALRDSELMAASDESAAVILLIMGNAKPGNWRRLLEKTCLLLLPLPTPILPQRITQLKLLNFRGAKLA